MMQGNINFQMFLESIEFVKKLYDFVRIVDPVAKRVSELEGNHVKNTDAICYDFWKEGRSCENCISARALLDEETHIKLEYNGERLYMITAVPVKFKDKSVVLELLKDVTIILYFLMWKAKALMI